MSLKQHHSDAARPVAVAVLTVSDTRTAESDHGGALVIELLNEAGHGVVDREIAPDEPMLIAELVARWVENPDVQAVLLTGGTGIAPRDLTYETITTMLTKQLPGYGELFRMLSYQEIGPAAMLSRAVGGVCGDTVVLTMPGSTAAVRLAMEKLILPELGHLVNEATKY
ncbi:MogA/MoaB family molybdenum cofactor biosynthesis protein [Aeoliella mucimassa]|uniref:Molybdenum cofactor biosynthesis protein B n=1 Tax=Aeoliella mucimassa TaxID=2527972 RepID=A0A518AQX0_9BACT|nr:MogA/MoaB family molybdenum cofactor biosynthesis protein [Aeoliella mucimassa]QDU57106.1 Molybdenum cofactor biosynthesis protein B [Aeoliella mucimassa]